MSRLLTKIETFKDICLAISNLSYDPKYNVGCIIFKNNFTEINSIGYNGNYAGGPNERDSLESGKSGFIHAEVNALLKLNIFDDPKNYTIMVTHSACSHCAKCIINSGIKKVIFLTRYKKDENFIEYFNNTGVKYLILDEIENEIELEKNIKKLYE